MNVNKICVRSLNVDQDTIRTAARTVSLAFAPDPLIRWLSLDPVGPGWASLSPVTQKWQEARLREYACRGIAAEAITDDPNPRQIGVCFLFPPKSQYQWWNPTWWLTYLQVIWEQYIVQPRGEAFANEEKVAAMFETHDIMATSIKRRFPSNTLWYLEIAAVHPDSQGMGVGSKLMEWVVRQLGDEPCYLECTDVNNLSFYKRYGFKVVEERILTSNTEGIDSSGMCTLYYMVRDEGVKAD